jgi:Cytochrome P460
MNQMFLRALGLLLSMAAALPAGQIPQYTAGGDLQFPQNYREWVYLSSGFDMSYNASMRMDSRHTFDNVFVNPESYRSFAETGRWPDQTMLALEVREAPGRGSINQRGNFQGERVAVEVHVKDKARFPGGWAFFAFDSGGKPQTSARMVSTSADCYSCHQQHGAVDTTFVQFYPTLLPVADAKGTLSAEYLKETTAPVKK